MVDASNPVAGYGGFLNEGFEHSNTELVFGTDNRLYVSSLTTISLNEELLLSYGAPFWLDPNRWYKLTSATQNVILSYYKCSPPTEPNPFLLTLTPPTHELPMDFDGTSCTITLPAGPEAIQGHE